MGNGRLSTWERRWSDHPYPIRPVPSASFLATSLNWPESVHFCAPSEFKIRRSGLRIPAQKL
jgi:hypothetical protein